MGKNSPDEMNTVLQEIERNQDSENNQVVETELGAQPQHPYAFHVSGPRNVPSINWRDLINSTWKDANYKRTVMACFIQSVYLLEIDRQETRSEETALASKWWTPFKYKLVETLRDERDNSIFGAILEWDRAAAMADFVLLRPSGAPRAILALRGTLLNRPTMRRDIEDDLRFLTCESLKGSVRFGIALNALTSISEKYGSGNVCVAGHSLGAGFALQIGKVLAKEGILVEAHLFNPPSVSLASGLRSVGEKAGMVWRRVVRKVSDGDEKREEDEDTVVCKKKQWVPHLYVNNSDYVCCYYNDPMEAAGKENLNQNRNRNQKVFVMSKGKQKFSEAHALEQWWSEGLDLQMNVNGNSRLISRQLKSLQQQTS